ncbi:hypothetical protein B7494_g4951 [Chlorociboria aeruginascens]|nr:hypothetical protein B7494_g4951 [Chlorociboria aeruginascens]
MQWAPLAVVALLAQIANGQNMLRFACSQLVVDRIDPLVNPGLAYSPHLHQLVGGNSLNLTMPTTGFDPAAESTCTSCTFAQDFSNYWTAVMFFRANNGTYKRVPQVGNGGPQGQLVNNGGLDVYYIPSGQTTAFQTARFPYACWNSHKYGYEQSELRKYMPPMLDNCWDGKNLDSPDHKSHVAYSGSGATGGGACPSAFPVKLPQIMYEIMWNVSTFPKSIWPTDGSNPFLYSTNIGGASAHGDYIFGWKGQALQNAMNDGCNLNTDCPSAGITAQAPAQYNACTKSQQAPEEVDGWLSAIPGFPAGSVPTSVAPTSPTEPTTPATQPTTPSGGTTVANGVNMHILQRILLSVPINGPPICFLLSSNEEATRSWLHLRPEENVYPVMLTGFTFSQYSAQYTLSESITIRIAVPSGVPSNTAFDVVVQVVAPIDVGWTGLAWGGGMLQDPLTVTWRNGNNVVVSSRYATARMQPLAYSQASYDIFRTGTQVNSTHFQYTALCSGCTYYTGANNAVHVLNPAGVNSLAFAYCATAPATPSSNTSTFTVHDVTGYWNHDFSTAENTAFTSLVAKNM